MVFWGGPATIAVMTEHQQCIYFKTLQLNKFYLFQYSRAFCGQMRKTLEVVCPYQFQACALDSFQQILKKLCHVFVTLSGPAAEHLH